MPAYYNEFDPFAAQWLRELIKKGLIADGEVDERSIIDVQPEDVREFTQCHFFAGIGVWSYALRQAGWPDDLPVWTGSCPCQPFSSAGKGKGFNDERHLWPEFYRLISKCRPTVCFGEQVASKPGLAWLDLVQTDMEEEGYAFGAVDTCAAGVGAPHIRQRLYWVGADTLGDSSSKGLEGCWGLGQEPVPQRREGTEGYNPKASGTFGMANAGRQLLTHAESARICRETPTEGEQMQQLGTDCPSVCGLAHPDSERCFGERVLLRGKETRWNEEHLSEASGGSRASRRPGPTNGFWRDADWLLCRDEKWRPTQPIVVEMADGLADRLGYSRFGDRRSLNPLIKKAENRVGRLKGYGNAINAEQAKAFIKAYLEIG